MPLPSSISDTTIWQTAFERPREDSSIEEQSYFKPAYLAMREKASILVSRIQADMPMMTVHDITHLDALWDTASLVSDANLTPPEAFVFGAAVLLHDSAMSIGAYAGGIEEIKRLPLWKDFYAQKFKVLSERNEKFNDIDLSNVEKLTLQDVLRSVHAEKAEALATQSWRDDRGESIFLIDNSEIRNFFGQTIGQIAHSHWWDLRKLEDHLSKKLGSFTPHSRNSVDKIKVACLLRVADAIHIDRRRAPAFLRAIINPKGVSEHHWSFQEKMARPYVKEDAIVFTSGRSFDRIDAEAWWLAYDIINGIDRELRDVDALLRGRGAVTLRVRRVEGAQSPRNLADFLSTNGWAPVDARVKASDVPKIVETLGGARLYGNDLLAPVRELIQNAADAVQARRRLQMRPDDWGEIEVNIIERPDGWWLTVEDTGVGMSEFVLCNHLTDFGRSLWTSQSAVDEFPGLLASGMSAIGRFGIGFFSCFMIGDTVRVISRRYDLGIEAARILYISGGPAGRPILMSAVPSEVPTDCGTRIEVLLKMNPFKAGGLLYEENGEQSLTHDLETVLAFVAPALEVNLVTQSRGKKTTVVKARDWLDISPRDLVSRLLKGVISESTFSYRHMTVIRDEQGKIHGRALLEPFAWRSNNGEGCLAIGGLRSDNILHMVGCLTAVPLTASRGRGIPTATKDCLSLWATDQAKRIGEDKSILPHWKMEASSIVKILGGDMGSLPIAYRGDVYYSTKKLKELVEESHELSFVFDGEFTYDQDDDVRERDFEEHFEMRDHLIVMMRRTLRVRREDSIMWPSADGNFSINITGRNLVKSILAEIWGLYTHETEFGTVGAVFDADIDRTYDHFSRTGPTRKRAKRRRSTDV